jgi:hypothetical protein
VLLIQKTCITTQEFLSINHGRKQSCKKENLFTLMQKYFSSLTVFEYLKSHGDHRGSRQDENILYNMIGSRQ